MHNLLPTAQPTYASYATTVPPTTPLRCLASVFIDGAAAMPPQRSFFDQDMRSLEGESLRGELSTDGHVYGKGTLVGPFRDNHGEVGSFDMDSSLSSERNVPR